jgi:hypothetical protein
MSKLGKRFAGDARVSGCRGTVQACKRASVQAEGAGARCQVASSARGTGIGGACLTTRDIGAF